LTYLNDILGENIDILKTSPSQFYSNVVHALACNPKVGVVDTTFRLDEMVIQREEVETHGVKWSPKPPPLQNPVVIFP
jgi:hypothetical protein